MNIYEQTDFRVVLKSALKDLQIKRPGVTLKKIAAAVPMQYTYLSKVLNSPDLVLSEEHLFAIAKQLEMPKSEIDFLLVLRSHQATQSGEHREFLDQKLELMRQQKKLKAKEVSSESSTKSEQEIMYLLEPLHVVVHIALALSEFREDPRKLLPHLGITYNQLKKIIRTLSKLGFIEMNEDGYRVKKLGESNLHFSKDHALMRYHQGLLKTQINSRISVTPEDDKQSFLATFTMDERAFEECKGLFRDFISKVEKATMNSRHKNVFQLSFDLFRWF